MARNSSQTLHGRDADRRATFLLNTPSFTKFAVDEKASHKATTMTTQRSQSDDSLYLHSTMYPSHTHDMFKATSTPNVSELSQLSEDSGFGDSLNASQQTPSLTDSLHLERFRTPCLKNRYVSRITSTHILTMNSRFRSTPFVSPIFPAVKTSRSNSLPLNSDPLPKLDLDLDHDDHHILHQDSGHFSDFPSCDLTPEHPISESITSDYESQTNSRDLDPLAECSSNKDKHINLSILPEAEKKLSHSTNVPEAWLKPCSMDQCININNYTPHHDHNIVELHMKSPDFLPKHNQDALPEAFTDLLDSIVLDRLIGRKMGLRNVDILCEMSSRNLGNCISLILGHLAVDDLSRLCEVSRDYKAICYRDSRAKTRLFAQQRHQKASFRHEKENLAVRSHKAKRSLSSTSEPVSKSRPLGELQVTVNTPSHHSNREVTTPYGSEKFGKFVQAASQLLNDESLQKCPRCQSPSRVLPVQSRAECFNKKCSFDFCVKCSLTFHGSTPCSTTKRFTSSTITAGSRKSRRNLKRL